MDTQRRDFIIHACGLCSSLIGVTLVLPAIQSCSTLVTYHGTITKGKIQVPISKFTAENNLVIVKNPEQEFDIALIKIKDEQYKAFELQCTHQSNPVIPTKTGFFCNAHGSSFSFEGQVLKPPAQKNLKEFPIEIDDQSINITT